MKSVAFTSAWFATFYLYDDLIYEAAKKHDLSAIQYRILLYLKTFGASHIKELSEILATRSNTLSASIKKLEQKALISKETSPEDRRAKLIYTTRLGADVVNEITSCLNKLLENAWSDITPAQREVLRKSFLTIYARIDKGEQLRQVARTLSIDQLFNLSFVIINQLIKKHIEDVIQRYAGLRITEFHILLICTEAHKKTPLTRINKQINIASSQLTLVVDRLVEINFVTREVNKEDRRSIYISITPLAKEYVDVITSKLTILLANLFNDLTEDELIEMYRASSTIINGYYK